MGMNPNNSLMVACGDAVVVADTCSAAAVSDVAVVGDVVVVVGAATAVSVWVQRCLMRPCRSLQFHFVSVVVTLTGKELSWRYQ